MAIRPIRLFPDGVLSAPCPFIREFDAALQQLIQDLFDTMAASPGVGLAAPQIGISASASVIDVGRVLQNRKMPSSYAGAVAIINPRIVASRGSQMPREGCLSVPDLLGNVQRFAEVDVVFQDPKGAEKHITATGFEALAFQHEIDHLNGRLFLDRVSNLKTDLFRRKPAG